MRRGSAATALVLAIAVVGCSQGAGPPPTPTSSIASASTPTQSASPTIGPTNGPTAPPTSEFCPANGLVATGPEVAIMDPDAKLRAPTGWMPVDIQNYRAHLQQFVAAINDPSVTKMGEWQVGLIDANVMRAGAAGRSEPSGAQTFLIISVLPKAADLKAVVDARLADEEANGVPMKVLELSPTELPIRPAYCLGMISDSAVGTPSQTIEYIAALADGRAIAIGATAPRGDAAFADLVRSVALTLAEG